ncbi:MAG: hypothetical protein JRJ84_06455 [Deltaproteobacteria bacterium]|nr:hypothetical protein [Deltaproteobacteria bacterium]
MRPLLLLALVGCNAPPDMDTFSQVRVHAPEDAETAHATFIDLFDSAEETLDIALPAIEDEALSDAIIDAWDRDVAVRVVTDIDRSADAGVVALLDAGVPLTLADDSITYFDFNILRDVEWTSDQAIMSHAFAIADGVRAVNATTAGTLDEGTRLVLDLQGEDLMIDLWIEHNQVFGGSDAVALTSYSSAAKSIADFRWAYSTQTDQLMEMWLGPQERLTKRIIDAIYSARASVWVLTDDFANDGLAAALQDKAEYDFDVEVVVGPNHGSSAYAISEVLRTETPNVSKHRICDPGEVPTLVLIDYVRARDGNRYTSRAFLLSHDLYAAARLYRSSEVINDQLIDGNLFVLNDYDAPSGAMEDLQQVWEDHLGLSTGGLTCP